MYVLTHAEVCTRKLCCSSCLLRFNGPSCNCAGKPCKESYRSLCSHAYKAGCPALHALPTPPIVVVLRAATEKAVP